MKLNMGTKDMKQIGIWGILQSRTNIWFLKCHPEFEQIFGEELHSMIYSITYSQPYSLVDVSQAVIVTKIYCKILWEGIKLKHLLETADFGTAPTICNTVKSPRSIHVKEYTIVETEIGKLPEESIPISQLGIDGVTNGENIIVSPSLEFIRTIQTQFQFTFRKVQQVQEKVVMRYLLLNLIKPCLMLWQNDMLTYIKPSSHYSKAKQIQVVFMHEKETFAAIFETVSQINSDKMVERSHKIDRKNDNRSNDNQEPSCKVISRSVVNHAIYCFVQSEDMKRYFLKICVAYECSEAVDIMNRLASKQLQHENINEVHHYSIIHIGNTMISATFCEKLHSYKQIHYELDAKWFIDCVIMASLNGLDYLHRNGIIHADISPGNIIFKQRGKDFVAVICDLNCSLSFDTLNNDTEYKLKSKKLFGTLGFYPSRNAKPSVYTDLYGWIKTICYLIYYKLFNRDWRATDYEDESIQVIFKQTYVQVEMKRLVSKIYTMYQRIVIKKEKNISVEQVKQFFAQVQAISLPQDKENIPPTI